MVIGSDYGDFQRIPQIVIEARKEQRRIKALKKARRAKRSQPNRLSPVLP